VGGVPEVIVDGESGLLVPPGDPEAIARECLRVMDDPDLARALGAAGRQRVAERFSAAASAEQLAGLYRTLVQRNPEP
jgi:glycosyltransferase involved in cell wall biosynthesis